MENFFLDEIDAARVLVAGGVRVLGDVNERRPVERRGAVRAVGRVAARRRRRVAVLLPGIFQSILPSNPVPLPPTGR